MRGDDKGKTGEVIRVYPKTGRVTIKGVNVVKRHRKARRAEEQSGIIELEAPIHASNVMLVHKGKPTRIGYKIKDDGTKVRIAKSTGEEI